MSKTLHLQFDPNQKHQLDAVNSIVNLFNGFSRSISPFSLGDEIVSNLPPSQALSESWLVENLHAVQIANGIQPDLLNQLSVDDSMVLEGAGSESWRYPNFTIEMETGTGKTYVYIRAIYELRKRYGFNKFIVVVPSIAIYEGVIKNFEITKSHFSGLYENETVNVIQYDGSRLSQLRSFATSTFVEVLVMTLDSFNKSSNVIYKPSEKLPGERLPYQFLQETHPILILDEPQNMESDLAKQALRTLHPLFALRFSATHRTSPNLIYRLSPFDAYRLGLVKRIQVLGVTERENFNRPFLSLLEVTLGKTIKARVKTHISDNGSLKEGEIILNHGDDLFTKTHNDSHQPKFIVSEISARPGNLFIEFENGIRLTLNNAIGPSKADIFRIQIRSALEQHMLAQQKLWRKEIKVLSLFFIDLVANYVNNGIIRTIFDEEFEKMKKKFLFYVQMSSNEVQSSYFAVYRGNIVETPTDDQARKTKEQKEAEKFAYELIMKDKEKLLSFDEKTCFIFAHSALKEGWDNPNVFQICTLNQTGSEMKKRQEIGRGLRLAVNQSGERVFDEDINVLTVIANESYEGYASRLQGEYVADGEVQLPPKPTQLGKTTVHRNDLIFKDTKAFQYFWSKLQKFARYEINIDTPALVQECVDRINNQSVPQAVIVVEKGGFIVTEYTILLESLSSESCRLKISQKDTQGNEDVHTHSFPLDTDLSKALHDDRLRGFKIVKFLQEGENPSIVFGNNVEVILGIPYIFQSEQGQKPSERSVLAPKETYPVFNFIDRIARESGLTRSTVNSIFKNLTDRKKQSIFANPEGFTSMFLIEVKNSLADHIAKRVKFIIEPAPTYWGHDLDDLFPPKKDFPQKELITSSPVCLYDQVQIDSDVEKRFVENRLNPDDKVIFYFKFPPSFKVNFPKVIGNYNPDWGIARLSPDGKVTLELVRETKGSVKIEDLQFPAEKRKLICAQKFFKTIGFDYRRIDDRVITWWETSDEILLQGDLL